MWQAPLVLNVIGRLNEQGELIQLLEEKVARQPEENVSGSEDQPDTADHAER